MRTITHNDSLARSANIVSENIAKLQTLFPEAFIEGKIDFEVLKQLLGGAVDEREEKFGLNWHGKRLARQIALTSTTATLRPVLDESVDWETTRNLMIEGDNLEVLKLLQKSYSGKVKMIYIDPPYNTGRDFVYQDDYHDNVRNYLLMTDQVDGHGARMSTNTEASGRFHTNWLNMMYPRLALARNLLQENGVIFISIDDNEIAHLRIICDEIFGAENFVATLTWETKRAARGVPPKTLLMQNHEYILCYAKMADQVRFRGLDRNEADFANPDNDPRGLWRSESMKATGNQDNWFSITDPSTGNVFHANWAFSKKTLEQMIEDNLVIFPKDPTGTPRQKKFLSSYTNETKAFVTSLGWYSTERATSEFMSLFDGRKVFDFPKPLDLLEFLCEQTLKPGDIILDFFAGSAASAHAALRLGARRSTQYRYIMVQLPEPTDRDSEAYKAGYTTIAEIAKERLRRVGKQLKLEYPHYKGDLGFRVFKLDSSNIRAWEPDREDLAQAIMEYEDHLKPDRSESDILYELLLRLGLDLCVPIEQKEIAGKWVYSVGGGVLITCLAGSISTNEAEPLALGLVAWHNELSPAGETTCIFLDGAFQNDVAKTNLTAILEQHGITNVRSL